MLADVDGCRCVRDLLADSLEGVRRADLKIYAVEGEVFCRRRTRAEGPNAFSWLEHPFHCGWRVEPGLAKMACIACITECYDFVRYRSKITKAALPFSTRSQH